MLSIAGPDPRRLPVFSDGNRVRGALPHPVVQVRENAPDHVSGVEIRRFFSNELVM